MCTRIRSCPPFNSKRSYNILFRRLAVIDEIMVRPAILADLDFGSG